MKQVFELRAWTEDEVVAAYEQSERYNREELPSEREEAFAYVVGDFID